MLVHCAPSGRDFPNHVPSEYICQEAASHAWGSGAPAHLTTKPTLARCNVTCPSGEHQSCNILGGKHALVYAKHVLDLVLQNSWRSSPNILTAAFKNTTGPPTTHINNTPKSDGRLQTSDGPLHKSDGLSDGPLQNMTGPSKATNPHIQQSPQI